MKRLWAPWRMEYILRDKSDKNCVFCKASQEDKDAEHKVLYRGTECFVILNIYPYNNGHLMVIPYGHVEDINCLTDSTLSEMMILVRESCRILRETMAPQGFNMGLNVGAAAGAGIKEHLHFHIVPRWNGDSNFMAVIDDVRVIPQALADSYELLKPGFEKLRVRGQ